MFLEDGCNALAPRTYICRKGDPSDKIFILLSGSIEALTEDGSVLHTFQADNRQALAHLQHNCSLSELPTDLFDTLTFLGEIGCLLNSPRSATLRVGKGDCVLFALPGRDAAFENLFLFNSGFRMTMAHNVANYVRNTNEKILAERRLIQEKIRKIALYQERADRIVATLTKALQAADQRAQGQIAAALDGIRSLLAEYKPYTKIEPMIQNSLEAISLIGQFEDLDESPQAFHRPGGNSTDNGDFSTINFNEGEIICCQNEQSDDIYFLMDGAVEVLIYDQVIEIIDRPGTFIGEISVLLGYGNTTQLTRTATMRALIPTRLAVKKGSHFINSVKHKPHIIRILFKSLTEKLQSSDRTLNEILKKSRNIKALLNDFKGPKILIRRLAAMASKVPDIMRHLSPLLDQEELQSLEQARSEGTG